VVTRSHFHTDSVLQTRWHYRRRRMRDYHTMPPRNGQCPVRARHDKIYKLDQSNWSFWIINIPLCVCRKWKINRKCSECEWIGNIVTSLAGQADMMMVMVIEEGRAIEIISGKKAPVQSVPTYVDHR